MTLRIGEIDIALDADTTGLRKGLVALARLNAAIDKAASSRAKGASAVTSALLRQDQAIRKSLQNLKNLQQQLNISGAPAQNVTKISNAFANLATAFAQGRVSAVEYQRRMGDFDVVIGRAQRSLVAYKQEVKAKAQADREAAASNQRLIIQENAVARAKEATLNLMARARAKGQEGLATQAVVNFAPFLAQMRSGVLSAEQFAAANRKLSAGLGDLQRNLKGIHAHADPKTISPLTRAIQALTGVTTLAAGPLSGLGSRMRALAAMSKDTSISMLAALGGVTAMATGLTLLTTSTIRTAIQMERINAIMFSVTKSHGAAAEAMAFSTKIARTYGLDLQTVAKGYAQMTAAAEGTSLEGEKLNTIFLGLAKASAATAMSTEQFEGAVLALQQMISKGNVQAEELRGQLGERLYGAFQKAAKAMNLTTAELNKMMKDGKLFAEEFLPKFAEVLNEDFASGAIAASQTLAGRIGTLSTAFTQFKMQFDVVSGASEKFKTTLNGIIKSLDWLTANMREVITVVVGLGGALIALNLGRIIAGFMTLVRWVGAATVGIGALNLAMATSPLGLFVRLLGAAGVGLAGYAAGALLAQKALAQTNDEQQRLVDLAKGYMDASAAQRTAMQDTRIELTRSGAKQLSTIQDNIAALRKQREELQAQRNAVKDVGFVQGVLNKINGEGISVEEQRARLDEKLNANRRATLESISQAAQIRDLITTVATAPAKATPFAPPPPDGGTEGGTKRIEDATKAYSDYANKIKDILDIQREMANLNQGLRMFETGKQDALDYAEALTKAENALAGLAAPEVQGVSNVLESLGYAGGSAAEQLAKLYMAQENLNNQVSDTRQAAEDAKRLAEERVELLREVGRETDVLARRLKAMKGGSDVLEAFDRNQERADMVYQLNERLKDVITSEKERNAILMQYNTLLEQSEIEARRMETAKEWASTISSIFEDLVFNITDAKFSLEDFFNNVHRMLTKKIVFEPFEKMIGDYIQKLLANQGGGGGGPLGGLGGAAQGIFNAVAGFFGGGGPGSIIAGATGGFANTMAIGQTAGAYANLGSFFPKLAEGGKLWSGVPTLVGERGPELITAKKDGYVTPNDQLPLGNTININMGFAKAPTTPEEKYSAMQTAAMVGQEVQKALARNT